LDQIHAMKIYKKSL